MVFPSIEKIIRYWWVYALLLLLMVAGEIFIEEQELKLVMLQDFLFFGILLVAALLMIACVLCLFRKYYWTFIAILVSGIVCVIALVYMFVVMLAHTDMSDDFGKQHPIPDGMVCYETKESFCIDDVDSTDTTTWLRIHDEFQPGIYEYQYFSTVLPDGYIYLKCFEATENIPLSEDRLPTRSKTQVNGHRDFGPVGGYHDFTIYEGDWGDYYAVRVEVWHHDSISGHERRLIEKTYRMQGWQR